MGCYCCPEDRHGCCYYVCCCYCCCRGVRRVFKVFCPRGVPAYCAIFTVLLFCMLMLFGGVLFLNQLGARTQVDIMYNNLMIEIGEKIQANAVDLAESLSRPAESIQELDPALLGCALPTNGSFSPTVLTREFDSYEAYDPENQYELESLGIIMPAGGSNSSLAYGWTIAKSNYSCEEYTYLYYDSSTGGREYGYCGFSNGTILTNEPPVVNCQAPVLTDLDQELLDGSIEASYTPVTPMFNTFVLGYKAGYKCPGQDKVYAITKAEKTLAQLDDYIGTFYLSDNGVIYVIETANGYLVSASVYNQTIRNGQRVLCTDADDYTIKRSAEILAEHAREVNMSWYHFKRPESLRQSGMVMAVRRVTEPGLDWIIVMASPDSDFFGEIFTAKTRSIIFSFVILLISLVLVGLTTRFCITKPLRRIVLERGRRNRGEPDSAEAEAEAFCLNEFNEVDEHYNRLNPASSPGSSDAHEL